MAQKGSNSSNLRAYNERVVLDAVRRFSHISKAEIARLTNLTPPAVAGIVEALVAGGYLVEAGKRFGGKGQPSAMYALAGTGAYSIGFHIGRRSLDAILLDFAGHACRFETYDYNHPEPEVIKRLIQRFKTHLGEEHDRNLVGIGVSVPYFIDGWDEELGFPRDVQMAWRAFDLKAFLSDSQNLPVFIENDASAAAIAELLYGLGKQYTDFLHISISTFVGGGLVLNGTLQTGPNGNTAALGPFPVTRSLLNTARKPSGKFDVLLHRASIYTLVHHLEHNGVKIQRVQELDEMSAVLLPLVSEWQDDCADALAQAIIGSIAVVDVQAIIIDGLLSRSILTETVDRTRHRFSDMMPPGLIPPQILTGTQGSQGAALGASILPMHAMFGPDKGVLMKTNNDKKPLLIGS